MVAGRYVSPAGIRLFIIQNGIRSVYGSSACVVWHAVQIDHVILWLRELLPELGYAARGQAWREKHLISLTYALNQGQFLCFPG